VLAAVDETQEVVSCGKGSKKGKSSRVGGVLRPLKGLRRVLTAAYGASSSPAVAATADARSAVGNRQSGEKVVEEDMVSEAGHMGSGALAQHLAKRRLRGGETEYTAPNLALREPISPGEKTRMWTDEILPAFESHLRKKWVHSLWRSGIPVPLRPRVWPLAIGNRLCLASSDYAKTLDLVLTGALVVKGVELIDLDLPRTRVKGSDLSRETMLHLGNLLRAVSALRPAQGYIQVCVCVYVCMCCCSVREKVRQREV
jgi:hypothetical protein